ncbi:MAG: DUF4469 domain-containing protein [Prevotellaceae bacterium]|jgi:hypothetical protein|nr:DUF4469 domain-containing protein [Prevotellaceae bacterium]
MTTIKTIAHPNELTKDVPNDYYLQQQIRGTLTLPDIIKRLEAREIATKNVNGEAFVGLVLDEIAAATLEGYNVTTPLFHTSISIKGAVSAQELGHNIPAEQVHVRMHFTQGAGVRNLVKESTVYAEEQPAPAGPVIQAITNPVIGNPDTLNAHNMALIQGLRIAVIGKKTDEIGVYFTSADNPAVVVRIPANRLSPNTPTRLQFVLPPTITIGLWKVKVATQASANASVLVKEVREYEYPNPVNVMDVIE